MYTTACIAATAVLYVCIVHSSCRRKLSRLRLRCHISWIPSHVGLDGNECVDSLASDAATDPDYNGEVSMAQIYYEKMFNASSKIKSTNTKTTSGLTVTMLRISMLYFLRPQWTQNTHWVMAPPLVNLPGFDAAVCLVIVICIGMVLRLHRTVNTVSSTHTNTSSTRSNMLSSIVQNMLSIPMIWFNLVRK